MHVSSMAQAVCYFLFTSSSPCVLGHNEQVIEIEGNTQNAPNARAATSMLFYVATYFVLFVCLYRTCTSKLTSLDTTYICTFDSDIG